MFSDFSNIDDSQLQVDALRENFEKLVTIFRNLREIIFTIDIDKGIIENVSNSIEILGYSRKDWEGQNFKTWPLSKRKRYFELIKHASRSSVQTSNKQIFFPTKGDENSLPFEFSTVLYTYKEKNYLLCVLRDISEREKLLYELEKSLQRERQLNELRAGFISTASHQFRTPLTIIQSGVEIMEMYLDGLPEEKRTPFYKQFQRIEGEVQRLQDLMNDILLLGRAGAKRTPFNPEILDLVSFCEEIINNKFNTRFPESRKISLTVIGKKQLLSFDPKLIGHCIENILNNAYKYSNKGNVEMQIQFEYESVTIAITDYGIGIPESDLPNLFQPFFRAANTYEIEGTGLGLSIVKDFIDEHKGQIFVVSEVNKGTTVTISLPLINNL